MQFNKYTGANYIKPQNGKGKKLYNKLFTDKILVIDTENLYVYDGNTGQLKIIENLKNIKYINEAKRKNIFITFHVILEKL